MLIIYVLAALLAVALIATFLLRVRSSRARPGSRQPDASASAATAAAARVTNEAGAGIPEPAERKVDFDPDATRVYMRTSTDSAAAAAPRERDGAAPDAPAGGRLVGLGGRQKGRSFAVAAAGITVGRSASCDVVLVDDRVSSRHAWIGIVDGKAVLRDLKSTNGTYLNAQTHLSISEAELRSGDTIFFGGHQGDQFRFLAD